MTWKDELRKAPFNIGQEQGVQMQNREDNKKKLLANLEHMLSKHVDRLLRAAVARNPTGNQYRVVMAPQIKEFILKLRGAGISEDTIEEIMAKQYNAYRVTLGDDRFIFYMKAGY
tara:strand:+ start:37 stop:381 length:345 start_codon:yes stop_codon:yes gene_type:complete